MYAERGDVPLPEVLESLKTVAEGQPVDLKGFADDSAVRDFFGKVLPDYDRDRVYTTDMRKLFNWYNQLIAAGIVEFVEKKRLKTKIRTTSGIINKRNKRLSGAIGNCVPMAPDKYLNSFLHHR